MKEIFDYIISKGGSVKFNIPMQLGMLRVKSIRAIAFTEQPPEEDIETQEGLKLHTDYYNKSKDLIKVKEQFEWVKEKPYRVIGIIAFIGEGKRELKPSTFVNFDRVLHMIKATPCKAIPFP